MITHQAERNYIDRGVYVHHSAVIYPGVVIESGVSIGAFCIIGGTAEISKEWHKKPSGKVIIRTGATLTGHVTVDSGHEGVTEIGKDCFLMKHSHVGHDAVLGQRVTLSPGAVVGGECTIGNDVNMGINSGVHQQTAIPAKCMIGAGAFVTKKSAAQMKPAETWGGVPARKIGQNKKWLKK